MKISNRDLLVLVKDEYYTREAMEVELEQLNRLLIDFETMENFCTAHEVFDMNKYKIISQPRKLEKIISKKETKAFVFISNKN
jgi:hypothetical protein